MNLDYKSMLPEDFSENSRIWIYQSSRLFSLPESIEIEDRLKSFLAVWNAHGSKVKGFGTLFFGRFIVLMADETSVQVSGCSTDSSVRFIRDLEHSFQVRLFDRTTLAFIKEDKVEILALSDFNHACLQGYIMADTLYFNNTILTKKDLVEKWVVPVKESWLSTRMHTKVPG